MHKVDSIVLIKSIKHSHRTSIILCACPPPPRPGRLPLQAPWICLSGIGNLRRTRQYVGLRATRNRTQKRVQASWWDTFVRQKPEMMGIETAILMHPNVWEASGHVSNFGDPLVECRKCHARPRGDKLLEEKLGVAAVAVLTLDQVQPMMMAEKIPCPDCGKCDWTPQRNSILCSARNRA